MACDDVSTQDIASNERLQAMELRLRNLEKDRDEAASSRDRAGVCTYTCMSVCICYASTTYAVGPILESMRMLKRRGVTLLLRAIDRSGTRTHLCLWLWVWLCSFVVEAATQASICVYTYIHHTMHNLQLRQPHRHERRLQRCPQEVSCKSRDRL
jgi:hypothetical protein